MKRSGRGGGFRRAGATSPGELGLPERQARRLSLEHGWERVAGEAIVRKARAVRVARGILEIEIADPSWDRELRPVLPRLVGRLARKNPDLRVRKFRVVRPGCAPGAPMLPDDRTEETVPAPEVSPPAAEEPGSPPGLDSPGPGELLDLARLYLDAGRRRR